MTPQFAFAVAILSALIGWTSAANAQNKLTSREIYDAWGVFVDDASQEKYCYAASEPVSTQASRANIRRDDPYLLVSNFPGRGVSNQVSVKFGFPVDGAKTVKLVVDGRSFELFNDDQDAWLETEALDSQAVAAMRKGLKASVSATSTRGTTVTDEYSLTGFTKSIERAASLCK